MMKSSTIKIFRSIIIFIIFFGVIGTYTYGRVSDLVFGPQIKVVSPYNGESFSADYIEISGNTKNVTELFLNNRLIFIDEDGSFLEKMLLQQGINDIAIIALDRFGKTKEEILEVVYQ